MDKPRKVYLPTEEQMESITTRLSALSRYVGPENSRTISMVLDELCRAETIHDREPLDEVIVKLAAAVKVGEQ